jgi:GT2 family glycosyltransferase
MLASGSKIANDKKHDALVVIPTIGDPELFLGFYKNLIDSLSVKAKVVISINPIDKSQADLSIKLINSLSIPAGCSLIIERAASPIGFSAAVNAGLMRGIKEGGLPKYVITLNDDLVLTPGWDTGLIRALEAKSFCSPTEIPDTDTLMRTSYDISNISKIGLVGPVTDYAGGMQQVVSRKELGSKSYEDFSKEWSATSFNKNVLMITNLIVGLCCGMKRAFVKDMLLDNGESYIGIYDEDSFPIGGFEDNDLCVRASLSGWGVGIAWDVFVGHLGSQTFDKYFPEHLRGRKNQSRYYEKWKCLTYRKDKNKLISVYRIKISTVNDLMMLKQSLLRHSDIVDGHAILLTNNPLDIINASDWVASGESLDPRDHQLLHDSSDKDAHGVAKAFRSWVRDVTNRVPEVKVEVWQQGFNERDERNRAIDIAESMNPDWCIYIDHDEILEDRINRGHLERYMRHPDPLVSTWELGWLNHWDSPRMCRIDGPWGDKGEFRGGMRGCRMWRVQRGQNKRILSGGPIGLHCGNIPPFFPSSIRQSGARFRHFGYLNSEDRFRKYKFYRKMDPNPSISEVGAPDYNHLINEEKMMMRVYNPVNGIGLHMLVYEKEEPTDIAVLLNDLHGMMDQIVLVWTGEWNDEDKFWSAAGFDAPSIEVWPTTGPSRELAHYAQAHNASIIHHPLENNIAEARNAGINHLNQFHKDGLGWALFLDPDEIFINMHDSITAIREMALSTVAWGWLFKYRNVLPGGGSSSSESVRMVKLDSNNTMQMNGRVHESFSLSVKCLQERGIHPSFQYAPFYSINYGLNQTPKQNAEKVKLYRSLLIKELEDNPLQPGPWVSLGMQYNNDGNPEMAKECYDRAVICAGTSFLPFMELALYHLRVGKSLLKEVITRTVSHHDAHDIAVKGVEVLNKLAPGQPFLDTGGPVARDALLPYFPFNELIDNIEESQNNSINESESFTIDEESSLRV